MAQIAEDLFLLLLDNASAQPNLERHRRERVLAAAVLLDLAYACRIRPAMVGEPVEPGRLIALAATPAAPDPVADPAFQLLRRRPLRPATAVKRLSRHAEAGVCGYLEQTAQLRRIAVGHRESAWLPTSRERVGHARSALLAALFDRNPPAPATAAIVSLLHAVDGLGALLSLNDRGWRWVHARAAEIASGSWVDEYPTALPEVNLAVTTSAVRHALG
ncbi:GOLPH3/VPS74 family protein [Mycolicibacterium holsaticum]|uniref:GOLPH3/VPS74 family protein n=1 Tax=Mycolicibacterium holsaticum TaxID=152142 RepID=UPI001C7D3CCA|nr:GPP34 family phosphoprotein [Mycolicibacterium holsaticum]MDA4105997.1 hypothetical protein [Mycolicibacterium holsaticum DSM 44478 = JCM 12374]QZA13665.1 GPP34 family phosphoprotein [Mycolicibacterium holsaticum DSM 44478 = JCM 12374]UNC08871.1 GPP34 family phosphoprotein [Mycolicibacterium holsaticum DSM 44478 = JCM 12374]